MKNRIILTLIFWSIFLFIQLKPAVALNDIKTPVILELFTSQSCSSCPSADKVLEKLDAENKNIIALSCNVTYWNHLHWKDTLSNEFCSQRQKNYVRTLQSRGPYTPQIIINGQNAMVGSKDNKIRKTIQNATSIKHIPLSRKDDTLHISLPETPGEDSYAINLIVYDKTHTQHIPRGENKGRTVRYTNPITEIISLGSWDGTGKKMKHDLRRTKTAAGYVVVAQKNSRTGAIIAAGRIQ